MALKVFDGFESYATMAQMNQRSGYLQWNTGAYGGALVVGRNPQGQGYDPGGSALDGRNTIIGTLASNLAVGFMGLAVYVGSRLDISLVDSYRGDTKFNVALDTSDNSVRTTVGRTGNNVFPKNTWIFLEIGWVCAVNGSIVVRIGTTEVYRATANLVGTGNAWVNSLVIHSLGGCVVDDFYLCDDQTVPGQLTANTFLGDRQIYALRLVQNSTNTGWASGGSGSLADNLLVNDGDTSYNQTDTVGAEALYQVAPLPAEVGQVLAVQITGSYRKTTAAPCTVGQRLNSSGVEVSGTSHVNVPTDYVSFTDLFTTNPATGGLWTPQALAGGLMKIGHVLEA